MKKNRNNRIVTEIVNDLASELDMSYEVVEAVVLSQFESAREEINKSRGDPYNAPNVRFIGIGQLTANKDLIEKINEQKKKKDGSNES